VKAHCGIVNVNVHLKMLLFPAPEKFNTFNTFNTFAIFTPALDDPIWVHRQVPQAGPTPECADATPHPPLLSPTGEGVEG
jgi:hypothetical protein